jgi:sugar (pentulose or hexulose) kinase
MSAQSIRRATPSTRGRKILAQAARPTPVRVLDGGRGEYDPDILFATVLGCLSETARALAGRPVAGLAVASLGESCVLLDEQGRSLAPSIVWHDRRTEAAAQAIGEQIGIDRLFELTGLALDPTLTLCKLA